MPYNFAADSFRKKKVCGRIKTIFVAASLGLVSPGAATDGVTLFLSPYFFSQKTDDLFGFLVISSGE